MDVEIFFAFYAFFFFEVTGGLAPANQPLQPTAAQRLGLRLLMEPFCGF